MTSHARTALAIAIASLLLAGGCSSSVGIPIGPPDGGAGDADADTDSDADADADADEVPDGGSDADDIAPDAGVPVTWIAIPAGTFMMGSPSEEVGRFYGSGSSAFEDLHEVTLTRGFVIQATEVTQAQFEAVMAYDPSEYSDCPDCPVDTVSWHEAAAYCNALSIAAGLSPCYLCLDRCRLIDDFDAPFDCPGYRLPTEAEWEYAARAGTTTAVYSGDLADVDCPNAALDPIALCCGTRDDEVRPVATRLPNAWGLFDMIGNVQEWTSDVVRDRLGFDPVTDPWGDETSREVWNSRTVRGGFFQEVTHRLDDVANCRAASRRGEDPLEFTNDGPRSIGFRPVRTLP